MPIWHHQKAYLEAPTESAQNMLCQLRGRKAQIDCELMISITANSLYACIAEDSGRRDEEANPRRPFTFEEVSYISRVNNAGESLVKQTEYTQSKSILITR